MKFAAIRGRAVRRLFPDRPRPAFLSPNFAQSLLDADARLAPRPVRPTKEGSHDRI
jgi:hypothetical protein